MSNFTLTISGGRLATDAPAALVETAFGPALQAAAALLRASLAAETPVKTGALQADWHIADKPTWDGSRLQLTLYNTRLYAPIVQVRGRSAGYADRGIAAGKDAALAALKTGGSALTARLWEPTS